jgi:hypothetical protein
MRVQVTHTCAFGNALVIGTANTLGISFISILKIVQNLFFLTSETKEVARQL